MVSNNALLLTTPDFFNLRENLKNFLKSQDRFKDYNFDGSNMAVLLDTLAFNTYQRAFADNMTINEMFLDSAQQYNSVASKAGELTYTPRSWRSARATVDVTITPSDNPGSINIPANTLFSSTYGNKSFTFVTSEAYTVISDEGKYAISDVPIYEGFLTQDVFSVDNTLDNQKFIISNKQTDTDSIRVFVTEGGAEAEYTYTDSIVGLTSSSNVFFIEYDYSNAYKIVFGDGIFGRRPVTDSVVRVPYRATQGPDANGAKAFRIGSSISGYSNVSVVTNTTASGGDKLEDIESVRRYAPKKNQNKGRAITDQDYEDILKNQFPEIDDINVYSGQYLDPPQYGYTAMSAIIAGVDGIPLSKQEEYARFIGSRNSLSISPVFIQPNYLYLSANVTVYYDYTSTSLSQNDIKTAVMGTITSYSDGIDQFKATFRGSPFETLIDASDPSINSSESDVRIFSRLDTTLLSTAIQTVNFGNQLVVSLDNPAVSSSSFKYTNQTCTLTDDAKGNVLIKTTTGAIIKNTGTIDYASGTVSITPFDFQQIYSSDFKLIVRPHFKDIKSQFNTVLKFDTSQIVINPIPQAR